MRLVIEADGGSRGNPGTAGSGTVILSEDGKRVLGRIAEFIGEETNNVAEYRALLNGLRAAQALGAQSVAVHMDSKLVVEQMTGRWKIKHPDMRALAIECRDLAAQIGQVSYTWVPRAKNSRADELANKAMDAGAAGHEAGYLDGYGIADLSAPEKETTAAPAGVPSTPQLGWATMAPTRLYLARHGQTEHSQRGVYSGNGSNPPLTDLGHTQAERLAAMLAGREDITAIVASPQLRAQQTAHHIADALGLTVDTLELLHELDFGAWEGLDFAEAHAADEELHSRWLSDTSVAPPGGESLQSAYRRAKKALAHITDTYGATGVVVVSHVTPIKSLLRIALDAGPSFYHRLHLDLASLSIAEFYADGPTSVKLIGAVG
ncbi:bifunctional RNase H/acid phosphatase [Corynebacterium sp. 13CS0277]|uniref:bifunctional RNase H/acid phosphatase n=1 Tax=Corynebacterium sp. 13CS0277 TaxID=2071994 RepID=UPI000D04645A|nr:bifunctional RNase H/acid phosphatase [Corynebacterium sp. 13CS0277]PRQ10725.1 bifunctional RNase H/acid phosphatase [Corynebacterium sp. 13CS0277]